MTENLTQIKLENIREVLDKIREFDYRYFSQYLSVNSNIFKPGKFDLSADLLTGVVREFFKIKRMPGAHYIVTKHQPKRELTCYKYLYDLLIAVTEDKNLHCQFTFSKYDDNTLKIELKELELTGPNTESDFS
jgi:hypothetical protein